MKGDASSETAWSILRRGLPQFAGFELLFRLLGLAVFIPSTAWLTSRLIAWSGSGAVSNYDLAGFFLSFKGLCYLIVVVTIGFALALLEFGGLTALAISLQRRERIRWQPPACLRERLGVEMLDPAIVGEGLEGRHPPVLRSRRRSDPEHHRGSDGKVDARVARVPEEAHVPCAAACERVPPPPVDPPAPRG